MTNLKLAAIAACFLFFAPDLWSRHIVGGDISYEYIGDAPGDAKRYRFTMHLYRDCFSGGAGFDDPAQMAIYRGNWTTSELLESFAVGNPNVTNLSISSGCGGAAPNLCFEQGTYTFERNFINVPGESFFIVYQRCCVPITLSNIINAGEVGYTIMVELTPDALATNNSSPVLPVYPATFLCIHKPVNIIQTATDKEGDQLVYTFSAPFAGGGTFLNPPDVSGCQGALPSPPCAPPYDTIAFTDPLYTSVVPMAGNPVIGIDSAEGIISGTPRIIGQFLVGMACQEFRNGMLLSTIRREITFNVFDSGLIDTEEQNHVATAFRVFPNPANGWVNWPETNEIEEIQVYDCLGQCVISHRGENLTGLNTNTLNPGFYRLIGITSNGQKIYSPLLVAR